MPEVDRDTLNAELLRLAPELHRFLSKLIPPGVSGVLTPQDVAQDVWVAALASSSELRPATIASRKRWLFVIARNELALALRKVCRIRRGGGKWVRTLDEHDSSSSSVLDKQLVVYDKSPGSFEAGVNEIRAMQVAIGELNEDHRNAIQCRHIKGMSESQTAQALGRSPDGIRSLVYRGMQRLRKALSG